jgi:hypothetical protein
LGEESFGGGDDLGLIGEEFIDVKALFTFLWEEQEFAAGFVLVFPEVENGPGGGGAQYEIRGEEVFIFFVLISDLIRHDFSGVLDTAPVLNGLESHFNSQPFALILIE